MNKQTPARSNVVVLKQLLNLIPRGMVNRHALETGAEAKARTFSVMSHLCAMLFAQLSHAIGLNDVCDSLRLKAAALSRFGITPPSRNALSHANKERGADFVEKLFWSVLGHLQHASPSFASGRKGKGLLRRFKVKIHAVDSTVIQLVANLHGLGEAPAAQGGGQDAPAARSPQLPAHLRHRGHRGPSRQQARPRGLRRHRGGRGRDLRQGLRGLPPSLRPRRPRRVVGHPRQGQHEVAR